MVNSHPATRIPMSLILCAVAVIFASACNKTYDVSTPPNMEMALALREAVAGGSSAPSGGGAAEEMAEPTGWATLKGRFTLTGPAPERQRLPITGGDAAVCAPGNKPVYACLLYTSPSPRDATLSRMPSSA